MLPSASENFGIAAAVALAAETYGWESIAGRLQGHYARLLAPQGARH